MKRLPVAMVVVLCGAAWAMPRGLLFHASFDKLTTDADFSAGSGKSTFTESLAVRSAEGVKGAGLLQRRGERCTYPIAGNLDTSQGTYSVWVKPLSWDGHSGKFRHFLVIDGGKTYTMLVYLYPIGDEAVLILPEVNVGTPQEAISRAGAPVDILPRGKWTHLVATWDETGLKLYANGKRVGQGLVAGKLPKLTEGTFALCPVDYWGNPQWGDPDEQTICDEVRIFDHALSDDEVLDLYALDVPGGMAGLKPKLAVAIEPDYFGQRLEVDVEAAHLDAAWEEKIKGGAVVKLTVTDPTGQTVGTYAGPLTEKPVPIAVKRWVDGAYRAKATMTAGGQTIEGEASITKPPTPWLPGKTDWRADRVLTPWTALKLKGQGITYWNGEVAMGGPLPAKISASGQDLLAGPVRLVTDAPTTWGAAKVIEDKPYRVSFAGSGKVGAMQAKYEALMEFDGLLRADITLTPPAGGADVRALTIEIPLRPEVAACYRNPRNQAWDGKALDEQEFVPYAWLGNEHRGLSWFMESAANWRIGQGQPAMTIRREGDAVVVRLRLISEPTKVTKAMTYTVGFEATPVRPVDPRLYDLRFAGGPQVKGSNLFVYGWPPQVSDLNARLIASDPAGQRKLVDAWRKAGAESLTYSCTQCTANISPEYLFFGREWHQPYGASFSGYKRPPDNEPYSMVGVCPRSSFPDFLLWCAEQNIRNDWSGGIYTDIDGATPCDNAQHGCGFTDVFGQSGRTWPLYAHRRVSRGLYTLCHDAGKLYFAHNHSWWYSLFNAFNDGWCPGEQFGATIYGKPKFYMDDVPDRQWRSEFYTPATGVATFLLPELGWMTNNQGPLEVGASETCVVAAMTYGVPLWASSIDQKTVEDVWSVQQAFGMKGVRFVPFWEQSEFTVSDPEVRVGYWARAGKRLVVVSNFTDQEREVVVTAKAAGAVVKGAWKAEAATVEGGKVTVKVPAKKGLLLVIEGMRE